MSVDRNTSYEVDRLSSDLIQTFAAVSEKLIDRENMRTYQQLICSMII